MSFGQRNTWRCTSREVEKWRCMLTGWHFTSVVVKVFLCVEGLLLCVEAGATHLENFPNAILHLHCASRVVLCVCALALRVEQEG